MPSHQIYRIAQGFRLPKTARALVSTLTTLAAATTLATGPVITPSVNSDFQYRAKVGAVSRAQLPAPAPTNPRIVSPSANVASPALLPSDSTNVPTVIIRSTVIDTRQKNTVAVEVQQPAPVQAPQTETVPVTSAPVESNETPTEVVITDPMQVLTAAEQVAAEALATAESNHATAEELAAQAEADVATAGIKLADAEAALAEANATYETRTLELENSALADQVAAAQAELDAANQRLTTAKANLTTVDSNITVLQRQLTTVQNQIANVPSEMGIDWDSLSEDQLEAIAESMLIEKINMYRVNAGLDAVPMTDRYNAEAARWTDTMVADKYLRHDANSRYDNENIANHYIRATGNEEIATYMANRFFEQWKNSATHNAGMLRGTVNAYGIGIEIDETTGYAWATLRGYVSYSTTGAWMPADSEAAYGISGLEAGTEYTSSLVRTQRNAPVSAPTRTVVSPVAIQDQEMLDELSAQAAQINNDLAAAQAERVDAAQAAASAQVEVNQAASTLDTAEAELAAANQQNEADLAAAQQAHTDALAEQAAADAAAAAAQDALATAEQDLAQAASNYEQAAAELAAEVAARDTEPVDVQDPASIDPASREVETTAGADTEAATDPIASE